MLDLIGVGVHVATEDRDATSDDPDAVKARDKANTDSAALWERTMALVNNMWQEELKREADKKQ